MLDAPLEGLGPVNDAVRDLLSHGPRRERRGLHQGRWSRCRSGRLISSTPRAGLPSRAGERKRERDEVRSGDEMNEERAYLAAFCLLRSI